MRLVRFSNRIHTVRPGSILLPLVITLTIIWVCGFLYMFFDSTFFSARLMSDTAFDQFENILEIWKLEREVWKQQRLDLEDRVAKRNAEKNRKQNSEDSIVNPTASPSPRLRYLVVHMNLPFTGGAALQDIVFANIPMPYEVFIDPARLPDYTPLPQNESVFSLSDDRLYNLDLTSGVFGFGMHHHQRFALMRRQFAYLVSFRHPLRRLYAQYRSDLAFYRKELHNATTLKQWIGWRGQQSIANNSSNSLERAPILSPFSPANNPATFIMSTYWDPYVATQSAPEHRRLSDHQLRTAMRNLMGGGDRPPVVVFFSEYPAASLAMANHALGWGLDKSTLRWMIAGLRGHPEYQRMEEDEKEYVRQFAAEDRIALKSNGVQLDMTLYGFALEMLQKEVAAAPKELQEWILEMEPEIEHWMQAKEPTR